MIVTANKVADTINGAYPFTCDMLPLSGPDRIPTPFHGMFRSDRTGLDSMVGYPVSPSYQPHTIDDVIAITEAGTHAFPGSELDISCCFRNGHIVTVGPTVDCRRSIRSEREGLFPRFGIDAGIGGSSLDINLFLHRDNCDNMIMISTEGSFSRKVRHTTNMRVRMPELIEEFRELGAQWENMIDIVAQMEARTVMVADFLKEVFQEPSEQDSKRVHTSYYSRMQEIMNRLLRDRSQMGYMDGNLEQATAWEAFNAVQGYVQHDQNRRGQPSQMDRAIMSTKSEYVRTALELALAS